MQLDMLSPAASTSVMVHLDPFVAFVDGDGAVLDRRPCRNGRVPRDLQGASSLRAVLSPPVLREWLQLVRRTGKHDWTSETLEQCHFVPLKSGTLG